MGSFKLTRLTDAIDRANGLSGVSDFQREVDDMYAELGNDRQEAKVAARQYPHRLYFFAIQFFSRDQLPNRVAFFII